MRPRARHLVVARVYRALRATAPRSREDCRNAPEKDRFAADRRHHAWNEWRGAFQAHREAHSRHKSVVHVRLHRRFGCAPGHQRKRDGVSAKTVHTFEFGKKSEGSAGWRGRPLKISQDADAEA